MTLPPFYTTKTLLGFAQGTPDLNRITLHMPGDEDFVLYKMGEPRTDEDRNWCNQLAHKLNDIWAKR